MRPAETVALGLLQGPAELLPVSSSAHVGLLLSRRHPDLAPAARKELEVALHLGTAVTLALTARSRPRWGLLAAATVPPALAGLALERPIEARLGTPPTVAAGLLLGAAAMVAADRVPGRRTAGEAGVRDGARLGVAQALALIPGVSRSGATRAAARASGFDRRAAAELSREVALPVLAGAATLKGVRLVQRRPPAGTVRALAAGAAAAAVSTYGALRAERVAGRRRALGRVGGLPGRAGRGDRRRRVARSGAMTDAYAESGVDTAAADRGVAALVDVLRTIDVGHPSRVVPLPGHFAAVLRIAPGIGLALGTDGVGSKLIVAEQAGRYDTVGIDCIAMNVNDVVCVGARPLAILDYLAVERADPEVMRQIGLGLKRGAELAGVEIPGGEVAVLPEMIRGHPSPNGFDLTAACVGTVALDAIVSGADCHPGDAVIGVPSSGLHSNGYSLARSALSGLALDDRPAQLGGASVADALLEPTVIYVRAVLDLLGSGLRVHGLAHITGGGLLNLTRLNDGVGFEISDPLPVPPVFGLVRELGGVTEAEMWEVFNMGCGFCAVVPATTADAATALLAAHHPGARRIGTVTDRARRVAVPSAGVELAA